MQIKINSKELEDYLGLAFLINMTVAVFMGNVLAIGFLVQALRLQAPAFTPVMWIILGFIYCHLAIGVTIYLIAKAIEYAQKD